MSPGERGRDFSRWILSNIFKRFFLLLLKEYFNNLSFQCQALTPIGLLCVTDDKRQQAKKWHQNIPMNFSSHSCSVIHCSRSPLAYIVTGVNPR